MQRKDLLIVLGTLLAATATHAAGVRDPIKRELSIDPNKAEACFVQLHGEEKGSLKAARELAVEYCVNLVYVHHPGDRNVTVDLPGGGTCAADPNRIFSEGGRKLYAMPSSCSNPAAAQAGLATYASRLLGYLKTCRVGGTVPLVAFHNNVGLSVSRAGVPEKIAGNPAVVDPAHSSVFALVTWRKDFDGLRATRNVMLQSKFPKDDGSLSVYFRGQRYLNLEAEPRDEVAGYANSKALALEALKVLGVRKRSAKKGCGKAVVF